MQNIDLLYTDKITFNGNNVEALYLNDIKIWGKPKTYNFDIRSTQIIDVAYALPTALKSYQIKCATGETPLRIDKPVAVMFDVSNSNVVVGIGATENENSVNIALDGVRLRTGTTNSFDILFRAGKIIPLGTRTVRPLAIYFQYPEV